jgi:riboflavin kinase/FMN adenylyltransferase
MNVVHTTGELGAGARPVCLAIGVFDGVHLGHQQVIHQAASDAAAHGGVAAVITFDRHPNAIVAPAREPLMIYPLSKKLRVISSLGPATVCVLQFDKAFSEIPGENFIRSLWRDCGEIHSISVGGTFTFGWRRSGNVALLNTMGKELGFAVHGLAEISLGGHPVSSTRVREAVQQGNFDQAGQMLGRPYALCGKVVKGAGQGRQIGVPTANLDLTGLLVPPSGVYASRALVRSQSYLAAVNIGHRPTVASTTPPIQVEAHLLDFQGEIYEEEIELTFLKKLREERKFPSLVALREQIQLDIAQVRSTAQ